MAVRLLLVVLALAGPLPVRACTCAAAPTVCTDAHCPAAPPVKSSCSCGHDHDDGDADRDDGGETIPVVDARHTHPPAHHADCPRVQVRAAPDASAPAEGDGSAPGLAACYATLPPEPVAAVAPAPLPPVRAAARPLFITLLTLRN